jgi:hypothetical protein
MGEWASGRTWVRVAADDVAEYAVAPVRVYLKTRFVTRSSEKAWGKAEVEKVGEAWLGTIEVISYE